MKTNDRIKGNPDATNDRSQSEKLNPEDLVSLFREIERKQAKKRRLLVSANVILFILYTALAVNQTGKTGTGYILCGLGFITGAAYLYIRYRPLPASAYTLPLIEYLRKTEKLLRYFSPVDYLVVIPLLILIGTGGGMIFTARLSQYTTRADLLLIIWIVFYTGLCLFGFFADRKRWKNEKGSIYHASREALRYLNGEKVN